MKDSNRKAQSVWGILIAGLPALAVLWIWLSPLAFVPVPWPDDSAFYFVAHELFKWPPRWVMLPQAPFEPTYRIWNFNTMPLYPILIGLGRFIGIDGSFLLKLWPLGALAATGSVLGYALYRAGLPALLALLIGFLTTFDPELRWAGVLVRPESLIAFLGTLLVLGLTLGFPGRVGRLTRFWDPVAAILAVSAYIHFNAIHLLFPVVVAFLRQPRRVFDIGWKAALYLLPWALTVLWKLDLFIKQMTMQWKRLAVGNGWLSSVQSAVGGLFQELGNPDPWPRGVLTWAGWGMWILIFVSVGVGFFGPLAEWIWLRTRRSEDTLPARNRLNLAIPAAWVVGSIWLWHTKPEVWFVCYIHFALWTFCGLLALDLWRAPDRAPAPMRAGARASQVWAIGLGLFLAAHLGIFSYVNFRQAYRMGQTRTWNWDQYESFVECTGRRLAKLEEELGYPKPFKVWAPTFPDILIELSKRYPDWDLTRTNDFHDRVPLALQHGHDAHAVVITETLQWSELDREGPMSSFPKIRSVWMDWKAYFLSKLYDEPGWHPNRYYCQRGRWQAFLYMKEPNASSQ